MNTGENMDQQKPMKFGDWLEYKRIQRAYELHRDVNQNEQAEWLGVPNTSYNQWENNLRLPRGVNIDLLAERLGPEVYEKLGVPERLPLDPAFRAWVNLYYAAKSEKVRAAMIRDVEKALERAIINELKKVLEE